MEVSMKLLVPFLLGTTLALSAQIPTKEELKAKADAKSDETKTKAMTEKAAK
jgi:hypothetical protein